MTAPAQAGWLCLPTCGVDDARFLALGSLVKTVVAADALTFEVGVPAGSTHLELGFFDGDVGGNWDDIQGDIQLEYRLYADPLLDGSTANRLATWTAPQMVDNAWTSFTLPVSAAARAPSGNYFYRLEVQSTVGAGATLASLKVRTSDGNSLVLTTRPFTIVPAMFSLADLAVLYPDYPNLEPTSYDGTWTLAFRSVASSISLTLWDGDLDRGRSDCTDNDRDDLGTPGAPWKPAWAGSEAASEGIATGEVVDCGTTTGSPPDDDLTLDVYRRSPTITYQLRLPGGTTVTNDNPSGNREWEQFLLTTTAGLLEADEQVAELPAGLYQLEISGLDLANLAGFHLPPLVGLCEDGTACGATLAARPLRSLGRRETSGSG